MAQLIIPTGSIFPGLPDVNKKFDSNATTQQFDLVSIQPVSTTSAEISVAAASELIAGVVNSKGSFTSASTGVEVNITPFLTIVMDNDNISTTFNPAHVGASFNIIGGTGAQLVDTSTVVTSMAIAAPTVPLRCIQYNPQGVRDDINTDLSVGRFMIIQPQFGAI